MKFNDREEIISLTPLWRGERFADGLKSPQVIWKRLGI